MTSTMETSHAGIDVEMAPIKQYRILPTAQIEALLRTQRAMPEVLADFKVNYVNYFLHCDEFLREYEAYGLDAAAYLSVFEEALAKMSPDIQESARAAIAAERIPEKRNLYQRARRTAGSLIDGLRSSRLPGEVNAERLGLHNILECATYVGALVDRHEASR